MFRILTLAFVILSACATGDLATQERLACLGEDASSRCASIWQRDLGPTAPPVAAPLHVEGRTAYTGEPNWLPPEPAYRQPETMQGTLGACREGGMAFGGGSTIVREIPGTSRRVGMVNPRPGDGLPQTQRCTCLTTPGGGATWSCR